MAGVQIDGVNNKIDFDDDLDTSISANTDDTLVFEIAGATDFTMTANTFTAASGSTIAAQALTATSITSTGNIIIPNAGNIGSAGDADSIAIASDGVVTLTQKLIGTELDISGNVDVDGTTNLDIVDIDGAVDMASTLGVSGVLTGTTAVFASTSADDNLVITSTDADAGDPAPDLVLYRNSSSPANGDDIGRIEFRTRNNNSQDFRAATIQCFAPAVADGSESGSFNLFTLVGGAEKNRVAFEAAEVVFNGNSADIDFRVESDNDANAFFVQGSDGHVGLGLSAPAVELHLKQTNNHPTIRFENSKTAGDSGDFLGKIEFEGNDENSGADGVRAFIHGATENSTGASSLRIGTASSSNAVNESFRIISDETVRILSENFGASIGTTNFGIEINKNGGNIFINHATNGTGLASHYAFINDNGVVGSITTNGSATAYNTSSDYRLKENVVTDWDATTRLKQLKPSRFNFKVDADTTVDGFLAHEVSSIVPEAVAGDKDGTEVYIDDNEQEQTRPVYQAIDQSKLVPLLVKTIQELEARITTLEG